MAEGFVPPGEDEDGAEEKPADMEPRGEGINTKVYWVTSNSMSEWTILPDLTPNDVKASRSIKVSFSGDLERDIITNPFFFGKEKHYLRAQIARISHSTTLVPKGVFNIPDPEAPKEIAPVEPDDEGNTFQPKTEEQSCLSNWVHHSKSILNNCRTGHLDQEPPEGSEIEPEEWNK